MIYPAPLAPSALQQVSAAMRSPVYVGPGDSQGSSTTEPSGSRVDLTMSIPYDEGVYLDKPWLAIRWDPDHRCVQAEFRAFANSAEFRAGCQTILSAIKDRKAVTLISDNRRLEGVTAEDQLWLRDTWFPLAVATGLTRIATVLAPRGLGRIASEQIIQRAGTDKLVIRTFDSMPNALSWVAPE